MITLKSYAAGAWIESSDPNPRILHHAVTGKPIARCSSDGVDFEKMLHWARATGRANLKSLHFQNRAELLKKMAAVLGEHRTELHEIAGSYGATKRDALLDVDGGIGTLGFYARTGSKQLAPVNFLVDGDVARLSKEGNFVGRHVYVPLEGAAVQINAYNFPSWGMLEKLAPAFLAGVPSIVKPATPTAWLAQRIVEILIESELAPPGSLQLICGSVGDLFDHLNCQDLVSFTGSASTGERIRSHPRIMAESVRINIEADSLNCVILGSDVKTDSETFTHFAREVVSEMTVKAGQKCTAIRRILVPTARADEVSDALSRALDEVAVGDPKQDGVTMGPLVDQSALDSARAGIDLLSQEAEFVRGDANRDFAPLGGYFMEPILMRCKADAADAAHRVEVFGPVATLIEYSGTEQAIELARRGGGSLVASIFSEDETFVEETLFALAPYHGRIMVMNAKAGPESTGHGVVMPQLVHGGPGRAGGGEELGGMRSVRHYMQRIALQGAPERLEALLAGAGEG